MEQVTEDFLHDNCWRDVSHPFQKSKLLRWLFAYTFTITTTGHTPSLNWLCYILKPHRLLAIAGTTVFARVSKLKELVQRYNEVGVNPQMKKADTYCIRFELIDCDHSARFLKDQQRTGN
jgi:hypothetical protein